MAAGVNHAGSVSPHMNVCMYVSDADSATVVRLELQR